MPSCTTPASANWKARWRGIAWLVEDAELSNRLKIKILNVGWPEICRDLERAIEFDQSQLFRKVYEEEFGSPGGEPYGLLVIDHEVRHRPTAAFRYLTTWARWQRCPAWPPLPSRPS